QGWGWTAPLEGRERNLGRKDEARDERYHNAEDIGNWLYEDRAQLAPGHNPGVAHHSSSSASRVCQPAADSASRSLSRKIDSRLRRREVISSRPQPALTAVAAIAVRVLSRPS